MEEPYYRDMAREMVVGLVIALASTGKQLCVLDLVACLSDHRILLGALKGASAPAAVWRLRNRIEKLGRAFDSTYTGLLTALSQCDHPAVNAYAPDIVLERDLNLGRIISFSLPANAYKSLARTIGIVVLQHVQQVGAQRQMDGARNPVPVSVFADEFYTFAYEGFIDALNKLRDANISMLLSHQSRSDLERISPEFARGVWDNTRSKVVMYSNDTELCEQLSASIGTEAATELTVRRGVDGFMNQTPMYEASDRQIDRFKHNPNLFKNLRIGQSYLVQAGIHAPITSRKPWWRRETRVEATRAIGINHAMLPALPDAKRPTPTAPDSSNGLNLYAQYIEGRRS